MAGCNTNIIIGTNLHTYPFQGEHDLCPQFIEKIGQFQKKLLEQESWSIDLHLLSEEFRELQRYRKDKFGICSPENKAKISEAFLQLETVIATYVFECREWPPTLLDDLDIDREERGALAKKIVSGNQIARIHVLKNLHQFRFSHVESYDFALFVVEHGGEVSPYIVDFDIPVESDRVTLAWKEINTLSFDGLSHYIHQFRISDPKIRLEMAKALIVKRMSVVHEKIENFHIEEEEERYQLILACLNQVGDKLLPFIDLWGLTLPHKIELAEKIGTISSSSDLFTQWDKFGFTEEISTSLAVSIAEKNQLCAYDFLDVFPTTPETKEFIRTTCPFFRLNAQILELLSGSGIPSKSIHGRFSEILQALHGLNKAHGIPLSLYRGHSSLEVFIEKIAKESTKEELVELTHLLNENYFVGTNHYLSIIFSAATRKKESRNKEEPDAYVHPQLRPLASLFLNRPATEKGSSYLPGATKIEIDTIVDQKMTGSRSSVYHTKMVSIEIMNEELEKFYHLEEKRGVFLINFDPGLRGHCSPLMVEREGDCLRIFNSDSVCSGALCFSEIIVKKLALLSFPTDLYVLTTARQRDYFSCGEFSMKDVSEAAKLMVSPEGFFHFLLAHSQLEKGFLLGVPVTFVGTLPVELQKFTQSLTTTASTSEQARYLVKKGVRMTLQEYVERHAYIGVIYDENGFSRKRVVHKKMNFAAAEKAAKHFEMALGELVRPKT